MITVVLIYIVGVIIHNLGKSGSASEAAPLPGLWADCDCDCEAGWLWGGNLLRGSWETLLHRCGVNFRASVSISAEGWYVKAFRHVINFFRSVLLFSLRMYIARCLDLLTTESSSTCCGNNHKWPGSQFGNWQTAKHDFKTHGWTLTRQVPRLTSSSKWAGETD